MRADRVMHFIRAHFERDQSRARTAALQIAADLADKKQHPHMVEQIRGLVERNKAANEGFIFAVPLDCQNLVREKLALPAMADVVLAPEQVARAERLVLEHEKRDALVDGGTLPRRRFLFHGPPGSGKSLLAQAIARRLDLRCFIVELHAVVGRYLGQTGGHLAKIWQMMRTVPGVYVLDEIDAVAGARGDSNDVGELNRVVSTLLQLFDGSDEMPSVLVATTNRLDALDKALVRRFQGQLAFSDPDVGLVLQLVHRRLGEHVAAQVEYLSEELYRLMHTAGVPVSLAAIAEACMAAKRTSIMEGPPVTGASVLAELERGGS